MTTRLQARALGLAFLLVGCAAIVASAGEPTPAILRIGNGAEPESLDPQRATTVASGNVLRDLDEGLTALGADGVIVPAAAESWSVDEAGRQWIFRLRAGLRWSNGDALVAEEFAAALRRVVDPATASGYAALLAPIDQAREIVAGRAALDTLGVDAPDPRTLRIRLATPAPYLPALLSHPATFPIHRASLAQYGADFARAGRRVSNGAYRLVSWELQSQLRLERNPYYWNDAHTAIAAVDYLPTEDASSEVKRYRAGELEITATIPTVQAPQLRATLGTQVHVAPYLGSYFYGYNLTRAPFAGQPALRRALSMVVDRELIATKVLNGLAVASDHLVPPGIAGYDAQQPEWAAWPLPRRIAEAQRLLADAGYSVARPLEVEIRYNTQDDNKRIAVVIAAMWKQRLGVRATLVNEEWKVFLQNRRARRITQAFRNTWIADFADPVGFLDLFRRAHPRNDSGYDNPAYDALLDDAATEPDAGRRARQLEAAEMLLLDDAAIVPIYSYASKHLVSPRVSGWQDNRLDWHYTKDLRLEPR